MKASVSTSVFLTRELKARNGASQKVLVLGGGDATGKDLAWRLAEEGFDVLLLGEASTHGLRKGIRLIADADLEEVQGFVGGFEVALRSGSGRLTEQAGFIVAAKPATMVPKYEAYGLARSSKILSLSELEANLQTESALERRAGDWFHAAFLLGLEGASHPAVFSRVLDAIEKLQSLGQVQTYVFTRHLKVAAFGLERRYRECRESGALFFKFDREGPYFESCADGPVIRFLDPLLGLEMELVPDLLAVDEELFPPQILEPIFDAMPSWRFAAPFLKPESTRFAAVETPKAGIFAVGASRGVFDPELIRGDIEAVVAALKRPIPEPPLAEFPGPPEIDPGKCTMCLTCVRLCPHGAISFSKQAAADVASCTRCGICAAECPMEAIKLTPEQPQDGIFERIRSDVPDAGAIGKIAVFLCSRSAAQAMESFGGSIGDNLVCITVPCAGTVGLNHIWAALESGAKGVIVAGCFKGNCASVYGNLLAEGRIGQARKFLTEIAVDSDRVKFVPIASNTPSVLVEAVRDMEEAIQ
ncbi:MAG: hydrogenase iron-sulfur subunit [Desulfomonilaceae bacterium]